MRAWKNGKTEFDSKWTPEPYTGCWLWTAATVHCGYGAMGYQNKVFRAHRLAWMFYVGPIPNGMWVLHKCDTPLCVNPDHLFLGTPADNSRDMILKSRKGKLTASQVRKIRASRSFLREIAKQYGISTTQASDIKRRKSWRHLPT